MASNCPIPTSRLRQICTEACTAAIGAQTTLYDHAQTASWNEQIINSVLKQLINAPPISNNAPDASSSAAASAEPQYKWIVNTTIIQHLSDPSARSNSADDGDDKKAKGKVGRRGMHSASGAFWNNEKDGMWSYKYEGGGVGEEKRGMDVVVSVMWIAV